MRVGFEECALEGLEESDVIFVLRVGFVEERMESTREKRLGWTRRLALRGMVVGGFPVSGPRVFAGASSETGSSAFDLVDSSRLTRVFFGGFVYGGLAEKGNGRPSVVRGPLYVDGNMNVRPGQLLQEGDSDFHACRHTQNTR